MKAINGYEFRGGRVYYWFDVKCKYVHIKYVYLYAYAPRPWTGTLWKSRSGSIRLFLLFFDDLHHVLYLTFAFSRCPRYFDQCSSPRSEHKCQLTQK